MVGIRLFPIGMAYFQVRAVSFREGSYLDVWRKRITGKQERTFQMRKILVDLVGGGKSRFLLADRSPYIYKYI